MNRLIGKVAVVTGASKGIGASIALHLAAEGAIVVVNYSTDKAGADRIVQTIATRGGTAIAVGANISRDAEVAALFDTVQQRYGQVDILVNNAATFSSGPFEAITADEFKRLFDTNVRGLLLVTQAASPLFSPLGGAVINLTSFVGTVAPAYMALYAATKGAINTITKTLAKELAPRNIRVNAISPGYVLTEGVKAAGMPGSPMEEQAIAMTPLGRAAMPEDIALPAVFLASDDARFITGEILSVTGGAGM